MTKSLVLGSRAGSRHVSSLSFFRVCSHSWVISGQVQAPVAAALLQQPTGVQTVVETGATDTNRFLLARIDASPIAAPLIETRDGLSESLALAQWELR